MDPPGACIDPDRRPLEGRDGAERADVDPGLAVFDQYPRVGLPVEEILERRVGRDGEAAVPPLDGPSHQPGAVEAGAAGRARERLEVFHAQDEARVEIPGLQEEGAGDRGELCRIGA